MDSLDSPVALPPSFLLPAMHLGHNPSRSFETLKVIHASMHRCIIGCLPEVAWHLKWTHLAGSLLLCCESLKVQCTNLCRLLQLGSKTAMRWRLGYPTPFRRWEMTIKTLQPRHLLDSLLGLGLVSKSWLNKLTESRYTVSNIFMRVSGFKWTCSFRLVWDGWDGSELTKCKWKAIPIRQSLWFCSAWHRF